MEHGAVEWTLAVVALAIMVGPTLVSRFRLPGVIGLVLMGLLAGPYALNLLDGAAMGTLGSIGLLYLMFQAGLEIDLAQFDANRRAAVLFGLLTFAFPLALGTLVGLRLDYALVSAMLIGSIWASHTLVTLPDVKVAGLGGHRVVTVTAGATVITDTLALTVLAIAVATADGGSLVGVTLTLGIGLALLAVYSFWLLPIVAKRFFTGIGRERSMRFALLLFGMASAAALATVFGIEGLIGAFLAGLGLNRVVPNQGALMERVEFFGASLLVPAFLVYVGTQIDPGLLFQASTLSLALVFLLVLILGKTAAAAVGGRVMHFSWAESGLMLGMTLPQAAATLAAVLVGSEAGLFGDDVVNAAVLVVVVSLLLGAIVTQSFARKVPLPEHGMPTLGESVLVPVAAQGDVSGLITVAQSVALMDDGVVHPAVIATTDGRLDQSAAKELLKATEEAAACAGADAECRIRQSVSVTSGVLQAVQEQAASMVMMQWDDRLAATDLAFGTVADRLGRRLAVPAAAGVFRTDTFADVLLALDIGGFLHGEGDAEDAVLALDVARATALNLGVMLRVIGASTEQLEALGVSMDKPKLEVVERPARTSWIDAMKLAEGTLIVAPPTMRMRLRPVASDANRYAGVSLVYVAGPGRLRVVPGSVQEESYFGWQFDMDAPVA